jgi:hypothetical protein
MNDEKFEDLMRDAAHSFRKPPEADLDAMWREIDARRATSDERPVVQLHRSSLVPHRSSIALIAATLVIGVAIGRYTAHPSTTPEAAPATTVASAQGIDAGPYDVETSRYLGQTAALLIALPSEVKAGRAGEQFVGRANELLSRTRLLLDSPAASDPRMHDLLEDLELVLAQVVRLQNDTTSRTELEIISRALEQRDVIPRLRTAVADISAN